MKSQVSGRRQGHGEAVGLGLLGALGFVAWGLWVNWEHGLASRIQVALTQGLIAFLATAGSAEVLRAIARRVGRFGWGTTAVIGWLVINGIVAIMHAIAGTPEQWLTMLPGMLTGIPFCALYGRRMTRLHGGGES